jgi:hypothetical protein
MGYATQPENLELKRTDRYQLVMNTDLADWLQYNELPDHSEW